jgi:glutamine---fructose-6-phosphate transaminase (isomerizing)
MTTLLDTPALMRAETLEAPQALRRFLGEGCPAALEAGRALRAGALRQVEVLGRGSSSHAGTAVRYAFADGGLWRVGAAMPSVAARPMPAGSWSGSALLAISQSGRSPDLVRYAQMARIAGAQVVALVNVTTSPLAATASHVVPLCAGPEHAVAATKSVIASMVAGLAVLAGARDDTDLLVALNALPGRLQQAASADWSALTRLLAGARAAYVVGRGVDLGIAKELALKMAEAVGVPALAFSSAEFLHGPVGAASALTPVLGVVSDRRDVTSVLEALKRAQDRGAPTLLAHGFDANDGLPPADLPLPPPAGSAADAVLALMPGYLAIEAAARAAGRDPDRPQGLAKVTETL